MDHEIAIQNQAAERYVLGEMDQQERDAFEEHFFSCEACAGDVRATTDFADAARAIFRERPSFVQPSRRWLAWPIPSLAWAAAAALCLIVIGYQNVAVIPGLRAPRSVTPSIIFDPATRSALPSLHQGDALHFQMPWDRGGPASVELRRDSQNISSGTVAAPASNQPLEVYFPGKLAPGHYTVIVRALVNGQPASESVENQFEVVP